MQAQAQRQAETQASGRAWKAEAALEVSRAAAAGGGGATCQTTKTESTGAPVLNLTQASPTTGERAPVTKSTGAEIQVVSLKKIPP